MIVLKCIIIIYCQRQKCSPLSVVSGSISLMPIGRGSLVRWCQLRVWSLKMRVFSVYLYGSFVWNSPLAFIGFTDRNFHGFARFPGDSRALVLVLSIAYTVWVKINPPCGLAAIFPKWLGIFQPNFTCLLRVPIYARLRIFIQLSATLTKLCHIKRDHPVHIMCARRPLSAETHFLTFFQNS